jgi:N-acetylneuraminic acid mutarotase
MKILSFVLFAVFMFVSTAHAQKWVRLAEFPEPTEELLGASAGGKLYVFCGLAPGWQPIGLVYEYDPATDTWTKKKPMPLASHHVAFTEYRGKIYAFGGFVLPQSGPSPAWVPIDNAWEYDPAEDSWKALAPVPTRRGSPVAVTAGDRLYVIGGATPGPKDTAVPLPGLHWSLGTIEAYDPATNPWHQRSAMPTPRNHATAGLVNGKIYDSAIHVMLQSRNYEEPSLLFNRLGNGIGAPA